MFKRYAIYVLPDGMFGQSGAQWLGWDVRERRLVAPSNGAPHAITSTPRRYGFHATIKAPFRLRDEYTQGQLCSAFADWCAATPPASLGPLEVKRLGRFYALTPRHQSSAVTDLAAQVVRQFSPFRAPITQEEIDRRVQKGMHPEAKDRLLKWGYPHVFEYFKFHITLSDRLSSEQMPQIEERAKKYFAPYLDADHTINHLSLVGEDSDGRFCEILTAQLQGPVAQNTQMHAPT